MKKLLIIIVAVVFASKGYSQNINFNWVQQLERKTGLPVDEGYFIATDGQKNVYIAGNFHFTVDLDPGLGVTNVTSQFENIFVCKFNSAGNFIWGKHLGKNDRYTVCKSLSVDAGGNVYTIGYLTGTADFDPGPGVFNLSSNSTANSESPDAFISCLSTDGNFKWAKQIGGSNIDIGNSINTDVFGNVYVTGYFSGVVDLDPGAGVSNQGKQNVVSTFITKLDSDGNFKYARAFEGTHTCVGNFIRTDIKGNVYTSGTFYGDVDFDPGPDVHNFVTGSSGEKNYLVKLNAAGEFAWALDDIAGLDIETDVYGNVYTYANALTKYDINGNVVWTKPLGGSPNATFVHADIKTDRLGNIFLTGQFSNTSDFDPGPGDHYLTANGGSAADIFVCELDNDGKYLWSTSFGGTSTDYATGIAIDNSDGIYTTGVFSGQVDFDPGVDLYNLTSASGGSVFIHKMSPCKKIPPDTLNVTVCKSYTLNNINYKSSGTYTQLLTTNTGCDSTIVLNLRINTIDTNIQATTCDKYSFHGRLLTASGRYSDTIQAINGCDSIVHLTLAITSTATSVNAVICSGEVYAGHTIAGTYTDTLRTVGGCDSIVTTHLTVLPKPAPSLGANAALCVGDSVTLSPGNFQTYMWQDGSSQSNYLVRSAGVYAVTVTNSCGSGHAEIKVTEADCKIYFPSAFTPNNDGKNDRFALLRPHEVADFQLSVYNRYGQLVYETKDFSAGWTGTFKSLPAPGGTYVWYCRFRQTGIMNNLKGTVLLVR